MKHMHAPWRSDFTTSHANTKKPDTSQQECVFCMQFKENKDEEHFIIRRFPLACLILNKYPYNAGHLLVLPLRHVGTIQELSADERTEIMEIASASTKILKDVCNAEGFNIGINIGKAAGASIPSHMHMHVLPRWIGDTNFMPALGETKVISFDLNTMYGILKKEFDAL